MYRVKEVICVTEKAWQRYCALEKELETDSEYMVLKQRFYDQLPEFQKVLQMLSSEYQSVIVEYMGICAEMAQRETEIACFME